MAGGWGEGEGKKRRKVAKVSSIFEDSAWGQNGNTYTPKKTILKSMKLKYLVKHSKIIP